MYPLQQFIPQNHNHERCISHALHNADALCQSQNLRFTPLRQHVLALVWERHAPVTAYDLLKRLRQSKPNAEAPTVYRALDFLLNNGLAHKIESLNAYVGCAHPGKTHACQFLICSKCCQAIELQDRLIQQTIKQQAAITGFNITNQTIEIKGVCPECVKS